ncbi:hypothetical protein SERLA73DRAFT_185585 [Serpula lacrymans var. lacrymans S7.3]|uniref:Uncharacterized protein n=1 Tax=Serpula lacrymans var. lacrymans (strain S7.3) TaxID=936435 RepID=F8Q628_SERL3|nr:hypothetical protein SERLA73DRAFT_185585 [Serpula lacrymans var. lacrymans S7.3]
MKDFSALQLHSPSQGDMPSPRKQNQHAFHIQFLHGMLVDSFTSGNSYRLLGYEPDS